MVKQWKFILTNPSYHSEHFPLTATTGQTCYADHTVQTLHAQVTVSHQIQRNLENSKFLQLFYITYI